MRHPFLRTLAGSAATPTDPNFENVTLLLHGDGTNGGQNNTFVDGSTNNFTITRNGNTTQGTFSPYGDNWSNYFDGTGDYLSLGPGAAFNFGTGDFTVEAWVFPTAQGNSGQGGFYFIDGRNSGQTNVWAFATNLNDAAGKAFQLDWFDGSTVMTTTSNLTQNTWNHVVYSRSGTTGSLFLNGTRAGTRTDSVNYNVSPTTSYVGSRYTNAYRLIGYLSGVRVVKGTAVYDPTQTTLTVPTAPLTAITNTSLLTCQSNRFRDASTNNFTITRNGDVSVQRFSPFSPTAAYAAGTIGGSGYFDGTGDYLSASSNAAFSFGTGDFTVECFFYPTSTDSTQYLYLLDATGGFTFGFEPSSLSVPSFLIGRRATAQDLLATYTIVPFQWLHLVAVRSGTTASLYINGTRVATGTNSLNYTVSGPVNVGAIATAGGYETNGYLSNVRVVKGTAVYDPTQTTLTVPTAPLTAITNTSLLLNFTNAAIVDNAMMAVPETVGNAQIDTTTKKFGTGSLEFDGTGDWLLIADSPNLNMGTGDFTIEAWVNRTSAVSGSSNADVIIAKGSNNFVISITNSTNKFSAGNYGVATLLTGTTTVSNGTWYHVAVTRSGTTMRLFVNGTEEASTTSSANFSSTTAFGVAVDPNFTTQRLNGYIDDLRITKGVARYTANFTAPTAAFPDL